MINRLALFIASVAAALTLTVALAAVGFGSGSAPIPSATAPSTGAPIDAGLADSQVQVDTIYVTAPAAQETITVHKTAPSSAEGEDDAEGEGAEDND